MEIAHIKEKKEERERHKKKKKNQRKESKNILKEDPCKERYKI